MIRVCGAEHLIVSNFRIARFHSTTRYLYRYARLQSVHDTRRVVTKISVFYLYPHNFWGFLILGIILLLSDWCGHYMVQEPSYSNPRMALRRAIDAGMSLADSCQDHFSKSTRSTKAYIVLELLDR